MRKQALVVLLGLALSALVACSNASPTATTEPAAAPTVAAEETATAAPAASAAPATSAAPTAAASATRSGAAPLPTATTAATVNPRATATGGVATRTTTPTGSGGALPTLAAGKPYADPQGRFSFTIPSNWTQVQAAGAEVAFQSPAPSGVIPATVNIVIEKLPSATVTLDEYDQAGEANLKQQFPDYKAVSLDRVTVDGKPAYKRVYTATIAGRVLQLQQVYLIERDTAYVISCGAPQEAFAASAAVFDQITGTFKIGR